VFGLWTPSEILTICEGTSQTSSYPYIYMVVLCELNFTYNKWYLSASCLDNNVRRLIFEDISETAHPGGPIWLCTFFLVRVLYVTNHNSYVNLKFGSRDNLKIILDIILCYNKFLLKRELQPIQYIFIYCYVICIHICVISWGSATSRKSQFVLLSLVRYSYTILQFHNI